MKRLNRESTQVLDAIAATGYHIEVVDASGVYRYLSPNCDYDLLSPQSMVKKRVLDAYSNQTESMLMRVASQGEPCLDIGMSYRSAKDGRLYQWLWSGYPIYDGAEVTGAVAIYREVDSLSAKIPSEEHIYFEVSAAGSNPIPIPDSAPNNILSAEIEQEFEHAKSMLETNHLIVLEGENGSGKASIARELHQRVHPTPNEKLIWVNCASLPEDDADTILFGASRDSYASHIDRKGLFDEAKNGTIYFDNIQLLPLSVQAKLVHTFEDGLFRRIGAVNEIPVRCDIILSIGPSLQAAMKSYSLDDNLFYCLSGSSIRIAPLRERANSMFTFLHKAIRDANIKYNKEFNTIEKDVLDFFLSYDWPGNFRELTNVVRYALTNSQPSQHAIEKCILPPYMQEMMKTTDFTGVIDSEDINYTDSLKKASEAFLKKFHERYVIDAINSCEGNISAAAKRMGISRQYLYKIISKYDIQY